MAKRSKDSSDPIEPVPELEVFVPPAPKSVRVQSLARPEPMLTADRMFKAQLRDSVVMAFVRNEQLGRVRKLTRDEWNRALEAFKRETR